MYGGLRIEPGHQPTLLVLRQRPQDFLDLGGRLSLAKVCQQLRRLHLTVWCAPLYTERLPQLRSRAAELLALWSAP